MKREVMITAQPIDELSMTRSRESSRKAGAVVRFLGIVRETESGSAISALEYEAFHEMALRQFDLLLDEMEKRWPVEWARIVHRVGVIKAGEPSLWLELAAPHRAEAFAACEWLINEMKRVVPIWKKPLPITA